MDGLLLQYNGNTWFADINITKSDEINYYYFIKQGNSIIRREWGSHRKVYIVKSKKQFVIQDLWKNKPYHNYLFSFVFTDTVFRHNKTTRTPKYFNQSILINVICPYVSSEQVLCINGSCLELGNCDNA